MSREGSDAGWKAHGCLEIYHIPGRSGILKALRVSGNVAREV